ncbi:uridine kinase [uncultured Thiothrix sp.]|uniref:uridine kinase n=1 Tax=uncultured Thiothrix sp. TaxID=223185 RepID=UPI002613A6C5|nr:uridine kinase [uncultured Thiothrix sp.]
MQASTPFFIGICGGSGSGKSELARALVAALPEDQSVLVELDSYYHAAINFPTKIKGNYDHPLSLDEPRLVEDLLKLKAGEMIHKPCYDFTVHNRARFSERVYPTPFIIIDGILLFALQQVAKLVDLSVFVDTPADIRLARRLLRDVRERGRTLDDVLAQYLNTVRPMHEQYVEIHKTKTDILVSGTDSIQAEVAAVLAALPK